MATALLFDRDQVDEVQDWTEHIDDLGRKSILWIDLDRADRAQILTLGALLFLPGALIAGVLGMNFKIGLFETGWYFWVVCAGIVALALATLGIARARHWI